MGQDKATLNVAGRPMAQWVATAMRDGGLNDVVILGPESVADINAVPDAEPGAGPLATLVGALEQIGDLFVCPCDVPTLRGELVSQIVSVADATKRLVVLAHSDRLEPLIGVYRASAAPPLQEALERGARGPLQALVDQEAIEYVSVSAAVADVRNVNEPDDMADVQQQLSARLTG